MIFDKNGVPCYKSAWYFLLLSCLKGPDMEEKKNEGKCCGCNDDAAKETEDKEKELELKDLEAIKDPKGGHGNRSSHT